MVIGTPARSASSRWLISAFSRASCKSAADGDGSFSASCGSVMTRSYDGGGSETLGAVTAHKVPVGGSRLGNRPDSRLTACSQPTMTPVIGRQIFGTELFFQFMD